MCVCVYVCVSLLSRARIDTRTHARAHVRTTQYVLCVWYQYEGGRYKVYTKYSQYMYICT